MKSMKRISVKAGLVVAGASVLAVGAGAGALAAGAPAVISPAGLSAGPGVATTQKPAPHYPVNARGETYGSAMDSNSPENEPDLIAVVTTNDLTPAQARNMAMSDVVATTKGAGKQGYVRKTELAEADGSNVKNPEEAMEWMRTGAKIDHAVPVYASDGVTVVGQFIVYGSNSTGSEPLNK